LICRPESDDPLSFGATDVVRDLAEDRPVVAILPDTLWPIGLLREGGITNRERLLAQTYLDFREDAGWTLAHPNDPEAARIARVDRTILGAFLRNVAKERRIGLDAFATYAWKASDAPSDMLGTILAPMMAEGLSVETFEWRALRLFGSFSTAERTLMLQGQRNTWENLTAKQRDLASWIVTNRIGSMTILPGRSAPPRALMMEPTELYAEGFGALTIALVSRDDHPLLCDSTTKNVKIGYARVLEPEQIGHSLADVSEYRAEFDRFAPIHRTRYTLTLSVRPGILSEGTFSDLARPKGKMVDLTSLPATIRAEIEKARDQAERSRTP
jgi:hypothetical protein